ncbi:FYVE zinc finger domain-containing protein, partial [bacterium]|nr:FYVE zinc finger domain-containing protein [bacterium]
MPKANHCYQCNSKFNFFKWRHDCEECGKTFCSKCITEFQNYSYYLLKTPIEKYENDYLCSTC